MNKSRIAYIIIGSIIGFIVGGFFNGFAAVFIDSSGSVGGVVGFALIIAGGILGNSRWMKNNAGSLLTPLDKESSRNSLVVDSADNNRSTALDSIGISTRVLNRLERAGITRVQEVVEMSDKELLALDHFGPAALSELRAKLATVSDVGNPQMTKIPTRPPAKVQPKSLELESVDEDVCEVCGTNMVIENRRLGPHRGMSRLWVCSNGDCAAVKSI